MDSLLNAYTAPTRSTQQSTSASTITPTAATTATSSTHGLHKSSIAAGPAVSGPMAFKPRSVAGALATGGGPGSGSGVTDAGAGGGKHSSAHGSSGTLSDLSAEERKHVRDMLANRGSWHVVAELEDELFDSNVDNSAITSLATRHHLHTQIESIASSATPASSSSSSPSSSSLSVSSPAPEPSIVSVLPHVNLRSGYGGRVAAVREAVDALKNEATSAARQAQAARESEREERERDEYNALMEGCPDDFICPITYEVFRDPVIASDGHTVCDYVTHHLI